MPVIGDHLFSFLPSFWTSSLQNVPILGSKFEIIELGRDFIDFIESDGLFLDDDTHLVSALSSSDEEYSVSDSETVAESYQRPSEIFPVLNEKIKNAISSLGGTVVPKLNWTVPKVTYFISLSFLHILYFLGFSLDFCEYIEMYIRKRGLSITQSIGQNSK